MVIIQQRDSSLTFLEEEGIPQASLTKYHIANHCSYVCCAARCFHDIIGYKKPTTGQE